MTSLLASALWWGAVLSIPLSLVALGTTWLSPRIMLHHYPKAIQARVSPKTRGENTATIAAVLVALPLLIAPPALISVMAQHSAGEAFIHAVTIILVMNLFDLVVIDWLLFCTITPRFMVVPGTEGAAEYSEFKPHAVGFLAGLPFTALGGGVAALAAFLWGGNLG